MSRSYTVDVDGVTYDGHTASAKNQFEAMHLAMHTGLISVMNDKDYSEMAVVGAFASISFESVQALDDLLMKGNVKRQGDDVPVGINLFGDEVQNYYLLLYHVVRENIGGFWKLRRPTDKQPPAEQ